MLPIGQICSVARFELFARRLLCGNQLGGYVNRRHGSGLEFDELREYQVGDDVRAIDWNSSVRTDSILVKKYREDFNRTVLVLVDGSASLFYGSHGFLKYNIAAQVAGIIAASAVYNNDAVGLIIYRDDEPVVIRPRSHGSHLPFLLNILFNYRVHYKLSASLDKVVKHSMAIQKNDSLVIIVSDFLDESYQSALATLSRFHEVVAVRIGDVKEKFFHMDACIDLVDSELDVTIPSMTQREGIRVAEHIAALYGEQDLFFKRHGIACFDAVSTTYSWERLVYFLRHRAY